MASLIAFARAPVRPNQIGYNRKLRLFASFNLIQHETSETLGKFWEEGRKNFQGNKDEISSSLYLPSACIIYHNLVHITKAMLTVCRAFEGGPSRISKNEDIDQDLKISGKSGSDCKTLDEKRNSAHNQYQPQETPETAILTGYQENGKAAERSESKLKRKGFDLKSSDNIKEETPGGKAENQAMVSLGEILWEDGKRIFEHLVSIISTFLKEVMNLPITNILID